MYSFYGGKLGRTYNIVQRYDSILKMIEAFSNGGAYTLANYGLYVIIDTPNKNNPLNGILYRRGFDYTQELVSRPSRTIIDSETGTEILNPDFWTITENDQNFNQLDWNTAWFNYIKLPGAGAIYVGQIVGPEGQAPDIQGMSWELFIAQTDKLIHSYDLSYTPGVEKQETELGIETKYNDVMQSGNCTIRDENDNIIGAYISFNIPSTIFKFSGIDISPYGETIEHLDYASGEKLNWTVEAKRNEQTGLLTGEYTNLVHQHNQSGPREEITQIDPETGEETVIETPHHPFYYDFQIAVPKGKQGKGITEFKIESNSDIGFLYQVEGELELSLYTDPLGYILDENGNQILDGNGNPIQAYEIDLNGNRIVDGLGRSAYNKDKYLTYTSIDYSLNAEGVETAHLGRWPYRVIDEISLLYNDRNIITKEEWSQLSNVIVNVNDLYSIDKEIVTEDNFYAVCIKAGYVDPTNLPDNFLSGMEEIENFVINYDNSSWTQENEEYSILPGTGSQWRIQRIPQTAAAASLRVNYTQGADAFFENKLRNVEYVTLDKRNNLYVVYSDDPNTSFLVGNLGKGILNISPIDRYRSYYVPDGDKLNNPQEGLIYNFNDEYYAVCIKSGSLNQANFPGIDLNNPPREGAVFPKTGSIFTVGQSSWRFIELPETSFSDISINYTDETFETLPFKQVDFIYTDDKGNLYVKYSNSDKSYFLTTIDSIKNVTTSDGQLIITYNSDREPTILSFPTNFNIVQEDSQIKIQYKFNNNQMEVVLPVKQVDTIEYTNQKDITKEQKFKVTYKGKNSSGDNYLTYESDAINSILDVKRIGDNVVVLYSDPNYRALISQGKTEGLDYYRIPWTDPITGTIYDTNSEIEGHKPTLVWQNLGALGAQYHVAGHYLITDLIDNGKLINGFIGDEADKAGWVVSVTNPENNDIVLYAYDYNDRSNQHTITYEGQTYNTNWYVIKNFEDSLFNISQHIIIDLEDINSTLIPSSHIEQVAGDIWLVLSKGHDNY